MGLACERGGRWERSLALLEEMQAHDLEPNVVTLSAAVSACAKGLQWDRALSLVEDMQSRGLTPVSFNAWAAHKGMQWDRTLSLLEEMRAGGLEPSVVAFSSAVLTCERSGNRAAAQVLYSHGIHGGLSVEQVNSFRKIFTEMDANGDGMLSATAPRHALQARGRRAPGGCAGDD